jgi:hypothetical protein
MLDRAEWMSDEKLKREASFEGRSFELGWFGDGV